MVNSRAMTRAEREGFLAGMHVGILSVDEPGRGPCTIPVWYAYAPGGPVQVTLSPVSRKAALLHERGRASLCAQSEKLPYAYVTIEGPAKIVEADVRELQRAIAERYLGPELAVRYLESQAQSLETEVLLQIEPKHWRSIDFAKLRI
jgi:hypothetical protein